MFYFIYGSDSIKVSEKAKNLVDGMLSKKPDASLFKLTSDRWSSAEFQELIAGQALFESKYIVQISRILDEKEANEVVMENLEALKNSDNVFIWTENEVDKKLLEKIEKYAEKVQELNSKQVFKKPEFNIFSLGDALGNRDKKKLWMLYQDALNYFAVEEIHGTLFWQVKNICISIKEKSATESGIKPFVFNKAKSFSKNYKEEEVYNMLNKLSKISHDSRRGIHDFEIALEKFCLEI